MTMEKSIVFRSRTEEYAVSVEQVVSIEKIDRITPVPHLPKYLLGFTRVRGELIPVLDFRIILYNEPSSDDSSKIIVLNTDVINYGLVVDEAREILTISNNELAQVGLVNYAKTQYFTAIANLENRMITCVDPKMLVNSIEGIREIMEYLSSLNEDKIK